MVGVEQNEIIIVARSAPFWIDCRRINVIQPAAPIIGDQPPARGDNTRVLRRVGNLKFVPIRSKQGRNQSQKKYQDAFLHDWANKSICGGGPSFLSFSASVCRAVRRTFPSGVNSDSSRFPRISWARSITPFGTPAS